jgi:enolase-phosphatase E1
LRAWAREGVRLRVFSSGSVHAQKLLFEEGDLSTLFEGFHDTTTGPKQDPRLPGNRPAAGAILFLSDVRGELAAAAAGLSTGLLLRPGNRPAEAGPHPSYTSFAGLA